MTAEAKNIPTTGAPTGATGVQDAVRGENRAPSGKPATNKGEVFTSFDVNAFEVPSGRDEIWRFTPLRRLRGLHDGSAVADGTATVEVAPVDGVRIETVGRDDARLGQGGVPFDRVAAQAYSSFESATVVTVGRETEIADPVVVTVTGPGEGKVAYGHLQVRLEAFARATVVVDQRGSGTYAENVEFIVGEDAQVWPMIAAGSSNSDIEYARGLRPDFDEESSAAETPATIDEAIDESAQQEEK